METEGGVLRHLGEVILTTSRDGRQLPTERELCQTLGISRTNLREQLRVLEMVGLLRRDQGRGTFVQSPDGTALGSLLDLALMADGVPQSDLMFVRRILERESAALATGRISESAHARLQKLCETMRAPVPADEIADADHEFHMLLLATSGNAALQLLGATLSQALHRSMREMRAFIGTDRRAQLDMARAHERVMDAVMAGDSALAWREMDRHFTLNHKVALRIEGRGASNGLVSRSAR